MNPEFQRNLWLEAGPRRLAWAGVALAAIYGAALLLGGEHGTDRALSIVGGLVFVVAGLVWAPRIAGRAVGDEVAQRTWEFQRLSALEPWAMTWGKLFGATSLAWLAALSGLVLGCLGALGEAAPENLLQAVLCALGGALLLQAGSMALALVGVRRARAEGRAAAFRFTFGGVVGVIVVATVVARTAPTGAWRVGGPWSWLLHARRGFDWWGLDIPVGWFLAFSLAAFAAWALVAAWRLMRLELQMRNLPWAWPGFAVFAGAWTAGLQDGGGARWAAAGLVFAACAYASAFAEPAERVRLRRFGARVAEGRFREAAYDAPPVIGPTLLAGIAVLGIALSWPSEPRGLDAGLALAAFAFMVRDLGIVTYFRFGPRLRRGDFGAVVALFVAYFVGGTFGANLGGPALALFLPSADATGLSTLAGAGSAAVIWTLAWRRIRQPERSEA